MLNWKDQGLPCYQFHKHSVMGGMFTLPLLGYPLANPTPWILPSFGWEGTRGQKTDSRLRVSSHILTMGGRVALCSS